MAAIIIPGQSDTYRHLHGRVTGLLADSGQNENEFRDVIVASGGNPDECMALRNNVVSAVGAKDAKLDRAKVKDELIRLLDSKKSVELSSAETQKLIAALRPKSGWKDFKVAGHHMLSGEIRASFDKLNLGLRKLGIFMVELGELERFHPDVSGASNKAEWLRSVLEKKLYQKSEPAKALMVAVASSILERQ